MGFDLNEQNNNGRRDSLPNNGRNYVDRSEKVKNFKVQFNEESTVYLAKDYQNKPAGKGGASSAGKRPSGAASKTNVPPPPMGVGQSRSARPAVSPDLKHSSQTGNGRKVASPAQRGGAASVGGSAGQPVNHSANHPANRQANQPLNRSAKPVKQSVKPKKKKLSKKAKRIKRKYSAATWITLSFILAATIALSYFATSTIDDILNINKSTEPVEVSIPENATTDEIIYILHDAGLINRPKMCCWFYEVYSKLRELDTPEYAVGQYDLKASMGLEGMLNELHVNTSEETIKILFQEGWSTYKIFSKLDEKGVCGADYLYAALEKANFNFDFVKEVSAKDADGRYLLLEGYLFPDTYEFYADTNASAVIELFLQNFKTKWTKDYQQRADELGYTMDEIITIASIIQREAGNKGQMADVASVIYNRLNNELSYPTLGCDSTADYITVDVTQSKGADVANAYLQNYDTAICTGLPAGPVCNPGIDAIEAALYPATTDYFYFLHDASGNIHLSKTFDEHQANINEFINN